MLFSRFALSFLALGLPPVAASAQNLAPQSNPQAPQAQPTASPKAVASPKTVASQTKLRPQTQHLAQFDPRGANGTGNQNGGQNANPLAAAILNAERNQDADALLLAYGQAVTDADFARAAIAQLLTSYYQMRNGAQTAEQATQAVAEANLRFQVLQSAQNQVMVQQNQQLLQQQAQIIALLQQGLKKK